MLSIVSLLSSCKDSEKKAVYTGKDLTNEASITRDKLTRAAYLNIETNEKWTLYAGNSVENINFGQPVEVGEGSGTFLLNVDNAVRSYFQLVINDDKAILAERHLPMTGGYNFRDLGGLKNKDGKYVKWGKIFRSDDLHNLTDGDLSYLSGIPLISIVDFRSEKEMEAAPDKNPASVKKNYPFSISPGNLMAAVNFDDFSTEQMDSAMMNMNELLVSDPECVSKYKQFFELLQDENSVPLMFHCSAGKDRTGMAAALVLFALGVDEETILEDYLSSNIYLSGKYANYIAENPNLKPLFEVKPEFLMAGINKIKKDYETPENYLEKVLGVDIQKMKQMYLY